MRDDTALLLDMLVAAQKIQRFTHALDAAGFYTNELVQSAVLRELQVIGEAARLISDATQTTYAQIPWRRIAGLRNRVIHEYFAVQLEIVWLVVRDELPALIDQLLPLIPPETDSPAE